MQAKKWITALTIALMTTGVMAEVSPSQISELGKSLTPTGAEKAGSQNGLIPAWTGGLTTVPTGFDPTKGYIDPYADEKPLFTITAKNVAEHKDRLSPGQLAMFEKYPESFRMHIYPTHRSAALPEAQYQNVKKYAASARLVSDGNAVDGVGDSPVPFPFPTTGQEVLWNHTLRWMGGSFTRDYSWYVVQQAGDHRRVAVTEKWVSERAGYLDQKRPNANVNFVGYYRKPATMLGLVYLVWNSLDESKEPRHSWVYDPEQRRVRRSPDRCCDYPVDDSEGLRVNDQYDGWSGTPDRYNWQLLGKQETYIPYNNFKLTDKSLTPDEILQPGHVNPDLIRYELHRTWVVEGAVKPDADHLYPRRVMYFDEDTYQLATADIYDANNQLWRMQETYAMQFYDVDVPLNSGMSFYDLKEGRYTFGFATFEEEQPIVFGEKLLLSDFQTDALLREGKKQESVH